MVNINKYIKALLHPAGGYQGSHKAHQAGNQKKTRPNCHWIGDYAQIGLHKSDSANRIFTM